MPNYKAKRHLTIGEGKVHFSIKPGEVFEATEAFHEEHLAPHAHAVETTEPVTSEVVKEEKKKAKAADKTEKHHTMEEKKFTKAKPKGKKTAKKPMPAPKKAAKRNTSKKLAV